MKCQTHLSVELVYVPLAPLTPNNRRMNNKILTFDEANEASSRQAGYYRCPVLGCHRVERLPYGEVLATHTRHMSLDKLCPTCKKPTDAPEHRRASSQYDCVACLRRKRSAWDAKRDPLRGTRKMGRHYKAVRG
jgi:hypothetical protein